MIELLKKILFLRSVDDPIRVILTQHEYIQALEYELAMRKIPLPKYTMVSFDSKRGYCYSLEERLEQVRQLYLRRRSD